MTSVVNTVALVRVFQCVLWVTLLSSSHYHSGHIFTYNVRCVLLLLLLLLLLGTSARVQTMASPISFLQYSLFLASALQFRMCSKSVACLAVISSYLPLRFYHGQSFSESPFRYFSALKRIMYSYYVVSLL